MLSRRPLLALLALTTLAGCGTSPVAANSVVDTPDYALVLFGDAGLALQETLGPQGPSAFDGRSEGLDALAGDLRLTPEQRAEIRSLREAFRAEHRDRLEALRSVMERARTARAEGNSREELRLLRQEGRTLAQEIRQAVHTLHQATLAVLTDAQRNWLAQRRPPRPPLP